jgi:glycerol-3-phosphate dehydrogenase
MGEDVVSKIPLLAGIDERDCVTCQIHIHGAARDLNFDEHWHVYGSDLPEIQNLIKENPVLGEQLHADLPYTKAEVIWSVRHEMARTIEDVLARRTRALFLNARVSLKMAKTVAELMAKELGEGDDWVQDQLKQYAELAKGYILE